jgi:hypothetical protein
MRAVLCPLLLLAALPVQVQAAEVRTPSGLDATLFDVVLEPDTGTARFRFVAPILTGGTVTFSDVSGDFLWLCEAMALPALAANGWTAGKIFVTLADREVPFGQMDPEAVQYIDGFEVRGTTCLWEDY